MKTISPEELNKRIELARQMLNGIDSTSFNVWLYASEGRVGGGWEDNSEITLSKKELISLIKDKCPHKEIFEGMELSEVNLDSQLAALAEDLAWDEVGGGARAYVDNCIPDELSYLEEMLYEDDESDEEADHASALKEELESICDDNYTFYFHIADGDESYYFEEDVEQEIFLTAQEALALLRGQFSDCEILNEMCDESLDEDFINEKAEQVIDASEYDHHEYGGTADTVDEFVDEWCNRIEKVMAGETDV